MREELAGGRFPERGGLRAVETTTSRPCPAGWAGIVTLDGAVPATAPTAAQVALLEAALPDTGSLPQWRARVGASQRVADKLGYRVLGEQRSLHLTA